MTKEEIEKLAEENNPSLIIYKYDEGITKSAYVSAIKNYEDGYNRCLQDKEEYIFTLRQLEQAIQLAHSDKGNKDEILEIIGFQASQAALLKDREQEMVAFLGWATKMKIRRSSFKEGFWFSDLTEERFSAVELLQLFKQEQK